MRKCLKFLIILWMLSIGIFVHAKDACENIAINAKPNVFHQNSNVILKFSGSSRSYQYAFYTLSEGGKNFFAYCRHAGKCASDNNCNGYVSTTQSFNCQKQLFDPTIKPTTVPEKATKAYEKGLITIIQNGYDWGGDKTTVEYVATNVALRTYEMLWLEENKNTSNENHKLNKPMQYYANMWIGDLDVQNKINTLNNYLGGSYLRTEKFYGASTSVEWLSNGTKLAETTMNPLIYKLVKDGLDAAIAYLHPQTGGSAWINWNEEAKTVRNLVTEDTNHNRVYKITNTHTFEIEKFTSSLAKINLNFTCENCTSIGVNYTLYANGQRIQNPSNIALLNYVNNGTGNVDFDIVFEGTSVYTNFEEAKYKIDIEYYDDTIKTEAYSLRDKGCQACQDFYMLYAEDVMKKATINETVEIQGLDLDCADAKELCLEERNSSACTIYYNKFNGDCAECTTYIENPKCSYSDNEVNINEGYDIDPDRCEQINPNNENVLQCVINGVDDSGNSYKATTEGQHNTGDFTNVKNNKYCSVWCKEDYHVELPGVKEVNSGRYFSLRATIEGAKTCYTSEINKTALDNDLNTLSQNMIEAYNKYSELYAITHGRLNVQDMRYATECGTGAIHGGCIPLEYSTCNEGYAKLSYSYTIYNTSGIPSNVSDSKEYVGAFGCCNGGPTCSSYRVSYNADMAVYRAQLAEAETLLKSRIKAYKEAVNEFNSCSGLKTVRYNESTFNFLDHSTIDGWEMNYTFDPTINFWYEEKYMNSVLTDELDTNGSVEISDVVQKVCSSNTNNSYDSCSSGWASKINNNTVNKIICQKDSNSVNGYTCGSYGLIISNAKYVKQTMTSEGRYITPTQFYTIYPTGTIVVGDEEVRNSSALKNKLPVGLGTRQGIYNYVLKINDLGEYYNSDKLGRLWGDNDSVLVNVLKNDDSCVKDGAIKDKVRIDGETFKDGVYVCAYEVNAPKCDIHDPSSPGYNDDWQSDGWVDACTPSGGGCPSGECPVECGPDGCINPNCPDNACPVECKNCLYSNNGSNISYRPITPSDINPNDKNSGINWRYDDNPISTALELKAYTTTTEIQDAGEKIYDINYEDEDSTEEFAMQVTLDAKLINEIKQYNKSHENEGGYANNTLMCYDYNGDDGITYKNVYCYSTFIDELYYKGYEDNIKIVGGNRVIGTNADDTDNLRKTNPNRWSYWTTWSEATLNSWTVITETEMAYYKENYTNLGIGPSWK